MSEVLEEEDSQKRYEDDFLIDTTIISLVKQNPIIFEDLGYDPAFLKNAFPDRDEKIKEVFDSIALFISNEKVTHYQYDLGGK